MFHYLLAVAACRYNVLVHGFCLMSNHFHLVVTDTDGRLPAFVQYLNSLVARALNVSLKRSESFWATPTKYSAVTLLSPKDVLEKTVYALANPVAAGLVSSGREWPGLWSSPEQLGSGPVTVHRPGFFFRKKGPLPATAELELTAPPGFESLAAFRDELVGALAEREREIAATMSAEGRDFLGARRVLAQKPTARPEAKEPTRRLSPSIAGGDKWKRIEALSGLVAFRKAYRVAWAKLRDGVDDVLFPPGTYWLRVAHGVRCEGAP